MKKKIIFSVFAAISSVISFFFLVHHTNAGKGWCRSEPIVIVDGQRYQILGGSSDPKALYVYTIYYADSYELIASRPGDEVIFFQLDEGFSAEVVAYNEEGEEIETTLTIRELG